MKGKFIVERWLLLGGLDKEKVIVNINEGCIWYNLAPGDIKSGWDGAVECWRSNGRTPVEIGWGDNCVILLLILLIKFTNFGK